MGRGRSRAGLTGHEGPSRQGGAGPSDAVGPPSDADLAAMDRLLDERAGQLTGITAEERDAMDGYKGSDYTDINAVLRGGNVDPEMYTDRMLQGLALSSLIAKSPPLERDIIVYRAVGRHNAQATTNFAFSSTSLSPEVALRFSTSANPVIQRIRIPAGTRVAQPRGVTDANVGGKEYELILKAGAKFRVGKSSTAKAFGPRASAGKITVIDMDYIP